MNRNSKLFAVLSYFFWVGFIISFILRDKDDTLVRRHLNQALIIHIISTLAGFVGRLGGIFATAASIVGFGCFILFIMGFVRAIKMSEEPLPIIGEYTLFA